MVPYHPQLGIAWTLLFSVTVCMLSQCFTRCKRSLKDYFESLWKRKENPRGKFTQQKTWDLLCSTKHLMRSRSSLSTVTNNERCHCRTTAGRHLREGRRRVSAQISGSILFPGSLPCGSIEYLLLAVIMGYCWCCYTDTSKAFSSVFPAKLKLLCKVCGPNVTGTQTAEHFLHINDEQGSLGAAPSCPWGQCWPKGLCHSACKTLPTLVWF